MRRIALILLGLALAACTAPTQSLTPTQPRTVAEAPPSPLEQDPALGWVPGRELTRDQVRDGLLWLMNGPGTDPGAKLDALFQRLGLEPYGPTALPYVAVDLDGDGEQEYALALPLTDPGRSEYARGTGAALFVIYRQDGRWAVDRTDPMSDHAEVQLMGPSLRAVADLAATGTPQLIWSRPQEIATGLQPTYFFVTAWKPGAFTTLSGEMAIANTSKEMPVMLLEGKDLVLTGGSRGQMFLPTHTDRYRYVAGSIQLVDRRFVNAGNSGYARFWDGVVAEAVGRTADAERSYREAADTSRIPHGGSVPRYHMQALQLEPAQLETFGQSLRTFARLRLGALLKETDREGEAAAVLREEGRTYAGLLEAMRTAPTGEAGCRAIAALAEADPEFLAAFNLGVSDDPWTPALLCDHPRLVEFLEPWNH